MRVLRIAATLLFGLSTAAAAQQQPMPGEFIYDTYKLRGREDCSANFSCNTTFNAWYGYNGGALAQSTSLKNCAQVEVETTESARYAVRVPLPTMGAKNLKELQQVLAIRMQQGDEPFGLETWQGRKLTLLPRNIISLDVQRCH